MNSSKVENPPVKLVYVCMLIATFFFLCFSNKDWGAGIAQLVVLGFAVHSVAGSILLWGHFR